MAVGRLVATRGTSDADARARVASQLRREQRLAHADDVVIDDGTLRALEDQVERLLAWISCQPDAVPTVDRTARTLSTGSHG